MSISNKTNGLNDDTAAAEEKNPAADLVRYKVDSAYQKEPSAETELADARAGKLHESKHQKFMIELSGSGRPLAQIQQAWHDYYASLPDHEKHEVWQEFYTLHSNRSLTYVPPHELALQPEKIAAKPLQRKLSKQAEEIKQRLIDTVSARGKLKASHHKRSLAVGVGVGVAVFFIVSFGFFNERFIAPFIAPSRTLSNSPVIIDANNATDNGIERVIIPKINVEVPVVYDEPSVEENAIQKALERGVIHYGPSPLPGEQGNSVIVGHSSNNILNKGRYKFAFVLLNRLEENDTFTLVRGGKRYVYRVYAKKIVEPGDLSVLGSTDRAASASLITCDPPGTSLRRLVVIGEQITPDPASNTASTSQPADQPKVVPGNAPSLWRRIINWLPG